MPELLLVDDDPGVSAALRVRLGAAGLAVRSASSGEEAIALAQERAPQIALTDIRMPGMDGIELCRRWKSDAATASFPVLFLSAETSETVRADAMDAGGVDLIAKPYDAGSLIERIHLALEANEETRESSERAYE